MATQMLSHTIYDISVTDENSRDCRKTFKMKSKTDPETMKIEAPGAVLEPSGDSLGGLGISGGAS